MGIMGPKLGLQTSATSAVNFEVQFLDVFGRKYPNFGQLLGVPVESHHLIDIYVLLCYMRTAEV